MKRILLVVTIFLIFMTKLNAECTYSDIVDLNTLASHINYTYEYNETNNSFDIIFYNVVKKLKFEYLNDTYEPMNDKILIQDVTEGTTVYVDVYSSKNTNCNNKLLRTIKFTLPYENIFYGTYYCEDYMALEICNTRFLNYQITYELFDGITKKYDEAKEEKEDTPKEEIPVQEESIIDNIFNFFKEYWLEGTVAIGSCLITFIIGNIVYNKIKYKI